MLIDDRLASALRVELFYDWLSAALLTVGIAAICVSLLRRRDLLLMYFGMFTAIYGLRLGIQREFVAMLFGGRVYSVVRPALDFIVPIPFFLFFRRAGLVRRRDNIVSSAMVGILLVLFVLCLFIGRPYWMTVVNNTTVLLAVGVFVTGLWRNPAVRDMQYVGWGFAAFVAGVLFDNLSGILNLWRFSVEPVGMMLFIAALGHLSIRRALHREEKLVALESELEVARNIQRSILPNTSPKSNAFRVAARYMPMTAVAGDFYDYVFESDDQLAILIADVSGHGIPAALIASMVKLTAATHRDCAENPATVLERMNKSLCGNTQAQFVTAALLYLDRAASCMRYSAAAHPPMLLLRNGSVSLIEQNGLMLAAFSFANYELKETELMPGDRYALYTDGLPEAESASAEAFGMERLKQAMEETQHHTPDHAADEILGRVQRWSGAQNDDLTLILCDVL
ncbi:MAG TPA: PP2C family protein-serine/threonine phosphatase [Terriglobales bacterium]